MSVHGDGDARVGGVEDPGERRVDRVGEDEGAGDKGHTEDHRDGGERKPELVAEKTSQADAEHPSAPRQVVSHRDDA